MENPNQKKVWYLIQLRNTRFGIPFLPKFPSFFDVSEGSFFQSFRKFQKNGIKLKYLVTQKNRSGLNSDLNIRFQVRNAEP